MNWPKISIVTPSFNQGKFIEQTIKSVINQKYPNLEYFIVDGGSKDNSVEIIKKYEDKINGWVSEPDQGQSDAIMKGFNRCTGKLFCWVNSDDVLFPGCLDMIGRYYHENKHPDIITANIIYMDENDVITRFIRVPRQSRLFFFHGVWPATQPCIFYATEIFQKVGGVNRKLNLSMDIDLWVRLMKYEASMIHIPCYLGAFRWHQAAKTFTSINGRSTPENTETIEILNNNLVNSSPLKRQLWRLVYKAYQVANFNYLIAYINYQKLPSACRWQDFVESSHFKTIINSYR